MTCVANVANHGTAPDLTASWWISAYTKGFAIGVVLLGFVLLYETVQVARRKTSGDELVETIAIWVPAWFAGVLFGPPLAQFLITGASYLTDGIVSSMTGYGAGDAFTAVAQATKDGAQVQQAGELVMALLSAIAVLVSALLVFISLCVQAVIIYLASAVFAVGWVWIVTARHRETAWRIPRLFIGIVFSKALLFFLLGVALPPVGRSAAAGRPPPWVRPSSAPWPVRAAPAAAGRPARWSATPDAPAPGAAPAAARRRRARPVSYTHLTLPTKRI